jgi:hypothetical protein
VTLVERIGTGTLVRRTDTLPYVAPGEEHPVRYYRDNRWSTWVVEAGYYGGHSYGKGSSRCTEHPGVEWVVEFAGDKRTAERIVRNQYRIASAMELVGDYHRRLKITFDGDRMTIAEYDHNRWSITVDALA